MKQQKNNCQLPGKVHRTHKCLYIPYMGKEYLFRDYEVLVIRGSPTTLTAICRETIRRHLSANIVAAYKGSVDCGCEFDRIGAKINDLPLPEKLKEFCKIDATEA